MLFNVVFYQAQPKGAPGQNEEQKGKARKTVTNGQLNKRPFFPHRLRKTHSSRDPQRVQGQPRL